MKKLTLSILSVLSALTLRSQEAVNSSGGDASGSGGSLSYSVGQVADRFYTASNGDANQGVQQPFEIFIVNVAEHSVERSISVFPNPVNDHLTVKMEVPFVCRQTIGKDLCGHQSAHLFCGMRIQFQPRL